MTQAGQLSHKSESVQIISNDFPVISEVAIAILSRNVIVTVTVLLCVKLMLYGTILAIIFNLTHTKIHDVQHDICERYLTKPVATRVALKVVEENKHVQQQQSSLLISQRHKNLWNACEYPYGLRDAVMQRSSIPK